MSSVFESLKQFKNDIYIFYILEMEKKQLPKNR
jgi:hypothetical protein